MDVFTRVRQRARFFWTTCIEDQATKLNYYSFSKCRLYAFFILKPAGDRTLRFPVHIMQYI